MPDQKGTLHPEDSGRYTLRFERVLSHAPERVWRAITEPGDLAHWFPADMRGQREAGAALTFVLPPEPGQVPADTEEEGTSMSGEMLVFDPPKHLAFLWDEDLLRFELSPHGIGTRLVFTHTFDDRARGARDASGWDVCLQKLDGVLDGSEPIPFTQEHYAALFTAYADRFGPEGSALKTPHV